MNSNSLAIYDPVIFPCIKKVISAAFWEEWPDFGEISINREKTLKEKVSCEMGK